MGLFLSRAGWVRTHSKRTLVYRQLLSAMWARWLYTLLLRIWMIQGLVLGITGHYYSPSRRRLVPSRVLRWYSWLMMLATLALYWGYWYYVQDYFVQGTFRRHVFVRSLSCGTVVLQLLALVVQTVLRMFREQEVCAVFNELMAMRSKVSRVHPQGEPSRFYYVVVFGKVFNYLQNFNFSLSILLIVDMRSVNVWDYLSNFYFVYMSLVRDTLLMSYILLLLELSEALRVNGEHPRTSYAGLMRQLQRQERLLRLVRRVHRLYAWQVLATMFFQLYFNMATFYVGYSFLAASSAPVSGFRVWNAKFLLTVFTFITKLFDGLLLQIVGERLLAQGINPCAGPQVEDVTYTQAAQRQMEMASLNRAIRAGSPENRVLGMFCIDMRCAFAVISSSLSYGIIIMQLGYIRS
ncbi:putative gustatory receptor 10b [Drosophila miranda]|uniref:putative gustatory receptor 10b n=1 Tax=Drosophila miranda TaxID=7229 RepID=UPI00143F6CA7|nr:putative gustatory receptor 10b [Drosophila miranda]